MLLVRTINTLIHIIGGYYTLLMRAYVLRMERMFLIRSIDITSRLWCMRIYMLRIHGFLFVMLWGACTCFCGTGMIPSINTLSPTKIFAKYMHINMCVYIHVFIHCKTYMHLYWLCVCVCVCVCACVLVLVLVYVCVCVCVCVCVIHIHMNVTYTYTHAYIHTYCIFAYFV